MHAVCIVQILPASVHTPRDISCEGHRGHLRPLSAAILLNNTELVMLHMIFIIWNLTGKHKT